MTTADTIPLSLELLTSRPAPFCELHGVTRLEVFGSVARGETHRRSDVDLLVIFRPEVHLGWDFFGLHEEIEQILGYRVDLLTRRSVEQHTNSIRRHSILESVQEIYAA